jgi:uncharacterized protein (DUF1501 family)
MRFTRRQFVKGGVSAFTIGFAAPPFLADLAFAQSAASRSLVVLYLGGGNDALSTLVPYRDQAYYSRRPTLAVPPGNVLQIGTDSSGIALGLHPRLTDVKSIYDQGRLAIVQRTGYLNSSRSHFQGFDIWGTANPVAPEGTGWLGRYLDTLTAPIDPLVGWNTARETPRPLVARTVGVPAITNPATYSFASPNPNSGNEALLERTAATKISSHLPVDRPHLAFVNSTAQGALGTLDRVATVAAYAPTITYPNNGLAQAFRAVAGAMNKRIGTKVFWVQTSGFDTHSGQGVNQGGYVNLMATLNDSLAAFYQDLNNQGLLDSTLIIVFSEFGRRINENGSAGCDHGAAGIMMAIGGSVRGGLYGTAADLRQDPGNPTLENNAADVKFETDFRSVYARVIDSWLGADSVALLGGNFKAGAPAFL